MSWSHHVVAGAAAANDLQRDEVTVAIPATEPSGACREFEREQAVRDINHLKRSYAWTRIDLTGINGART